MREPDSGTVAKILLRRVKRLAGIICAFGLIAGLIGVWMAAGELVSPSRRAIQPYHHEWLDQPREHGLRITRFQTTQDGVPCIMVEPDGDASPGERGKLLREQLSANGQTVSAYGTIRGTALLLHGRNGRKEDLLPVAERFCAAGYRCLLPDLPAHGDNPASTVRFATSTGEAHLAETVLTDAAQQFHFPSDPAILWGMSMGGAFAVRSASVSPERWRALVVVSSFASLSNVIDGQLRRIGFAAAPIRTIVGIVASLRGGVSLAEAQPAEWAANVKIPVLVAHGTRDTLIPLRDGRRLFEAFASSEKQFVEVSAGDHSRVLVTPMPLYSTMSAWMLSHTDSR